LGGAEFKFQLGHQLLILPAILTGFSLLSTVPAVKGFVHFDYLYNLQASYVAVKAQMNAPFYLSKCPISFYFNGIHEMVDHYTEMHRYCY
jgi:hypothetical protein